MNKNSPPLTRSKAKEQQQSGACSLASQSPLLAGNTGYVPPEAPTCTKIDSEKSVVELVTEIFLAQARHLGATNFTQGTSIEELLSYFRDRHRKVKNQKVINQNHDAVETLVVVLEQYVAGDRVRLVCLDEGFIPALTSCINNRVNPLYIIDCILDVDSCDSSPTLEKNYQLYSFLSPSSELENTIVESKDRTLTAKRSLNFDSASTNFSQGNLKNKLPSSTNTHSTPLVTSSALQSALGTVNSEQQQLNNNQQIIAVAPAAQPALIMATPKLPCFLKEAPSVWFIAVEAILTANNITDDAAKYNMIISNLDPNILLEVADIIKTPPNTNKFTNLKTKIVERFAESSEKQLQRLFNDLRLDDRKPTQLLRHMRDLANGQVQDDALKVRWMALLPSRHHEILSAVTAADLDALAKIADKLCEMTTTSNSSGIYTISQGSTDVAAAGNTYSYNTEDMLKRILTLVQQNSNYAGRQRNNFSSGDRSRSRSRSQSPNRSSANFEFCWYHRRWGAAANKCTQPCNFRRKPKPSPNTGNANNLNNLSPN